MPNRIVIDGKIFRKREGKVVEIPAKWVGKVAYKQTINKRHSKGRPERATSFRLFQQERKLLRHNARTDFDFLTEE